EVDSEPHVRPMELPGQWLERIRRANGRHCSIVERGLARCAQHLRIGRLNAAIRIYLERHVDDAFVSEHCRLRHNRHPIALYGLEHALDIRLEVNSFRWRQDLNLITNRRALAARTRRELPLA